ncbi:class I adenylate-forming enzyme family protein [Enhygromyxa salina]|uniref:Long-chain-fatty-acid--CoA ligase n=1 Tax=Enhygromyxa salina TaxID=215803 RepID=A0A2S9YDL4_9BACT|nr:AMP-binding protein [Enhygromyxa salina]PRQ03101.1 Long-chain-fatty-acid--CoA ligase [Enhygromyxa salina]
MSNDEGNMSDDPTAHLFAALERGDSGLAYEFEGERLTWADLDARARSYAQALADAGIAKGERVVVYAQTCLELIISLFGNYYLGAVHVPVNNRYREAELAHILADCQPSAIICDREGESVMAGALAQAGLTRAPVRVGIGDGAVGAGFATLLDSSPDQAPPRPGARDPALMIYTSGTTGPSKGALLSHAQVINNMRALTGLWTWSSRDRLVLALPLFHVHGLCIGVHGAAIHGMAVLLERRFDVAAVIERFGEHERGRASVFMGVPTMYTSLVEHLRSNPAAAAKLACGRMFTSGSAALSADLWHEFAALTGQRIIERYGMTETLITLSNPYVGVRIAGTVGQPVPGCDAAVIDDAGDELPPGEPGELIVHSNGLMDGYWNLPQQTAATRVIDRDGRFWFRTGDVAYVGDQGYFHIVGRKSVDIIKSGGFKISAREIEEVLAGHPIVHEVAVVGVPDEKWGQKIVACVVPDAPMAGILDDPGQLLESLVALHRALLADYKQPRGLYLCDELPRNALGKLQKHRLLEAIERDGLNAEL